MMNTQLAFEPMNGAMGNKSGANYNWNSPLSSYVHYRYLGSGVVAK
jgi:hypothetical protein